MMVCGVDVLVHLVTRCLVSCSAARSLSSLVMWCEKLGYGAQEGGFVFYCWRLGGMGGDSSRGSNHMV